MGFGLALMPVDLRGFGKRRVSVKEHGAVGLVGLLADPLPIFRRVLVRDDLIGGEEPLGLAHVLVKRILWIAELAYSAVGRAVTPAAIAPDRGKREVVVLVRALLVLEHAALGHEGDPH